MSRIDSGKTKCPCGEELIFPVKKPSACVPTVSKIACKHCGSRFLMHVEVDRDQKIPKPRTPEEFRTLSCQPFQRQYKHRFELIRLSPEGAKRSSNPIRQAVSMIVEKVSKRDNGPEFKD